MSIKEEIHALTDEMLTNLGRLVAIDSQLGTPAEGMPFGEGPAKALKVGLKIAEELGFKTVNLDNYCGYAEMGEGDEIVGIAGHLDIVPAGGDWTYDPFTLTRDGDYVYGRGTTDDKGPILEALYAMKLLRDSGVKLNKRVRLIMGCNEENGSKCMEHYNEVAEELSCGFTPDASYPCIHGEKGGVHMMAYSKNTKIISMNGGFVVNAVCDSYNTHLGTSCDGAGIGLKFADAYGDLTFCNGIVKTEDGVISCTIDIRVPVTLKEEELRSMCEGKLEDENGRIEIRSVGESLFFPADSPLVTALYKAYVDVTGDTENKPMVIGGGTYAKSLKNIIAFGPEMPGIDYRIHSADEYILVSGMEESVLIYMEAIKNLLAI